MNKLNFPVAVAVALLVAGCSREEAVSAKAATPVATTTVGTEIDDTVLTTKVKSVLLGDAEVKGLEIKVETRKGVVQLSGFIESKAQADRAILIVGAMAGVKGTENNMTLKDGKASVGNTVDDGIVTAKVKTALLSDASVKSTDINVVTSKGSVQLSGFVDNQAQIERAIDVTRTVEGVQGVVNEMSIKK